ncbi:two-partner secretion domain-containing protein [Methyloversatilis sp. NSM2]|uniref:two-partner secretion domain-containing protein n=1 Tax=Methyloversatilis sp. NSM2 TaxID=3134135 RepID=UPI0031103AA2
MRSIRRHLAASMSVVMLMASLPVRADLTPDATAAAHQQARVGTVGGVSVVDIVAADARGTSHNRWSAFDVPARGLVLNNAPTGASSALVGSVPANTNLGGAAASLIVNEVTGNRPSALLGHIEVAGQAARLVIANPNGISCDGCGFVGTPHVQLTTGRPVWADGALHFDVTGGRIDIGASGLAALAARIDLVAQTVRTRGELRTTGDARLFAGRAVVDSTSLVPDDLAAYPQGSDDFIAIDIGQTVSAGSIQLIAMGENIGVRTSAPLLAAADILIASRQTVLLDAAVSAGRDVEFYNIGAMDSALSASVEAGRHLHFVGTGLDLAAAASMSAGGDIGLGFVGDNSDGWTALRNAGRIEAGSALSMSGLGMGLNTGVIRSGGTMNAAAATVRVPDHQRHLTGAHSSRAIDDERAPVRMLNAGAMSAGLDLFVNAADNEDGSLVAARDLFLWQEPQQSAASGNASAGRDLFLFAPVPDEHEPPQVSGRLFRAASDLYLLDAPDVLSDHDTLRTQLLAGTATSNGSGTDDYVNRDTLAAGRDLQVLLDARFANASVIEAGRDLTIVAKEVSNETRVDSRRVEVAYEYFDGCRTEYAGVCSADIEQPAAPATMVAGRDLTVSAQRFVNRGARVLAGGRIDITAPDFLNEDRRYGAAWSSRYSLIDPETQFGDDGSCGDVATDVCLDPIDWMRSASGSVELGVLPGIIQAGADFSVGQPPDGGAGGTPGGGSRPPPAPVPSADRSALLLASLARLIDQGPGSLGNVPTALSSFVNTGSIHAGSMAVRADHIRNGFDVVADYYHRTAELSLPPAAIDVAAYGAHGGLAVPPGDYSGAALMRLLPADLASSAPFALTPEEETAALRNALLATTHRGWILPGLSWDPLTGQSPEAQQRTLLAANGYAFAVEHGIPMGSALGEAQQSLLRSPILWYVERDGALRPWIYLPEDWQSQLAVIPGGLLDADVGIVIVGSTVDNTGFVLSDGTLSVTADELLNRKRSAYYYEEFKVDGGTLIVEGSQVQAGGFMQAAQWALDIDRIQSLSGEFRLLGDGVDDTRQRSAAFEAQLAEELGSRFVRDVARDDLHYRFEKDFGFSDVMGMATSFLVASMIGVDVSTFIGSFASPGSVFAAASSAGAAGFGNTVASAFVTQTISSSIGQMVASGRLDIGNALNSGLAAGLSAGSAQWTGTTFNDPLERFAARALTSGLIGEVTGSSFEAALLYSAVNQASALGAGRIGDGVFGEHGSVGHLLAHGALGAMAEAARGGDPMAGAIGAMTAVLVERPIDASLGLSGSPGGDALLTALSMMAGGAAAEGVGGNAVSGALAAQNVTLFNYLTHAESQALERLRQKCSIASRCTDADRMEMRRLGTLDRNRDEALSTACSAPSSTACQAAYLDLARAVASYQERRIEPGSVTDRELASIQALETMYRMRMTHAMVYNVVDGAAQSVATGLAGTIELGTLLIRAPVDPAARDALAQLAVATGQFLQSPIDTIEQGIKAQLDEAARLEAAGEIDAAQRMRAALFTDGVLTVSGGAGIFAGTGGRTLGVLQRASKDTKQQSGPREVVDPRDETVLTVDSASTDSSALREASQSPGGRNVDFLINERAAAVELRRLESNIQDAHFVSRHGPETSLSAQRLRAQTGITPDGVQGRSIDASRWASYQDMAEAIRKAQIIYNNTGQTSVTIDLGRTIGDGYLKGGVTYAQTTKAVIRFDARGMPYTAYPKLR